MNWFIVVYFLVNGLWIEADQVGKEGWSPIIQPSYEICIKKINETNDRFKKIAEYREIDVDISFRCECRKNVEQPNKINCKPRNWLQQLLDKLIIDKIK